MTRFPLLALWVSGVVAVAAPVPKEGPWVTVRGAVVWPAGDTIPELPLIDVTNDKEACCAGTLRSNELLIDPKTRGVRNVVVWLRPDSDDRKATFPKDRVHPDRAKPKPVHHVVKAEKCLWEPRILAARAGDTWEFDNRDTVAHNANAQHNSDHASDFNVVLLPMKAHKPEEPLTAHPTPIHVKCDIHPWMHGRARVFDHPYFALTDKDGKFELKDVPKGSWRVMYWHERGYHKSVAGALGFPLKVDKATGDLLLKDVELELPNPNR